MMGAVAELANVDVLQWDSDFWDLRIAQVSHPVVAWEEHDIDCAFLLVDAADTDRIRLAVMARFEVMDVRVTLRSTHGSAKSGGRPVEPEDVKALARIARRSHHLTRFYADPRFPDERCHDLYETWIRNSVNGWADSVRVVGPIGAPVGYVTVHADRERSQLGLIAVDESARGHGYGLHLARAALWEAWNLGCSRMTVVTQGRNVQAQRVFQRAGFVTVKTELWFHRWMDA
jgi:dTDP-4-amino-4,6-dideoxy-D-galactose acyltransferase